MKKNIMFLIVVIIGVNALRAQCVSNATADITVLGVSHNPSSTIVLPYSQSSNSRFLVSFNPHPYNSLNTGQWETWILFKVNNNPNIPGISSMANGTTPTATLPNNFRHMAGSGSSGRYIPYSSLNEGPNTICVFYKCGSGPETQFACFNIVKEGPPPPPSGNINLTQECCVTQGPSSGTPPRPTTVYTGQVKFKMTGSVTNAKLKIVSNGGVTYENFVQNGYTQCYSYPLTITIVDVNNNPVSNSTINNASSYVISSRFNRSCINIRRISRPSHFIRASYSMFRPEILVDGLGNLVDKSVSSLNLSYEMALPSKMENRRKLIPAIEVGAGYHKFSYNNGLSLMQKRYPALAASESRMVKVQDENESNRIITVSVIPKLVIPIGRLNLSAGAGATYLNYSVPNMNLQDELIKTSSSKSLEYSSSNCCMPPRVRGTFGGDFRLSLSYWVNKIVAVNAGGGYFLGPIITTKVSLLNAADSNNDKLYSTGELRNGTMQLTEFKYSFNDFRLNAGITIALQRKHEYYKHVTLLK